jgi:hypothetical protein
MYGYDGMGPGGWPPFYMPPVPPIPPKTKNEFKQFLRNIEQWQSWMNKQDKKEDKKIEGGLKVMDWFCILCLLTPFIQLGSIYIIVQMVKSIAH